MGILDKIFKTSSDDVFVFPTSVRFGRYSDAYKPEKKYDSWDKAMDLFEQGKYIKSFKQLFEYLRDEDQQNIKYWQDKDVLHFDVFQGSKLISGTIDQTMIKAEAKIAITEKLNIGFLRRMMELNFSLKYGRYALDENDNLTLVFDSYLLDGSPYKMYYALKEVAVSADKQDDLLVGEFQTLKPINTAHIRQLPEDHKQIKVDFLRQKIQDTLHEIDNGRLKQDQYAGAMGYLLLDLAYRLDYLVKPEGEITEALERIHRIYFAEDNSSNSEKNLRVRKEFMTIVNRTDEELKAELYLASSSFGITSPGTHEQLVSFIDREIGHMDWYIDNKHERVALAFPGYIAGYSLFNFAYLPPAKDLLHLYYHITEPAFFSSLGFPSVFYEVRTGTLDKKGIIKTLNAWKDRHKAKYPRLIFDSRLLQFDKLSTFSKSYFQMIRSLDLTKAQ